MKRGASRVWVHTLVNRLTSRERSLRKGNPKTPGVRHFLVSSSLRFAGSLAHLLEESRVNDGGRGGVGRDRAEESGVRGERRQRTTRPMGPSPTLRRFSTSNDSISTTATASSPVTAT